MIKSGTTVVIVDSVEKAVKFYTEKLAFDIADLCSTKRETGEEILNYATIRKGKFFIMFRTPEIEELAEFSFIKRCSNRCIGIYIEMKKGFDKYYQRCKKKGILIASEPKQMPWGDKIFSIKDPFGIRLTFAQSIEGFTSKEKKFLNLDINKNNLTGNPVQDAAIIDKMVKYLKTFGILRRAAKKYSKLWIKSLFKKKK